MGRLRDRMREDLELRGSSPATVSTYLRCVQKFAEHSGRSPTLTGSEEIRKFMLHLVREKKARPRTVNVYAGAIKFLYGVTLGRPQEAGAIPRMKVPMQLPVVLSGTEVERLLNALPSATHRAVAMLAYGAGLRVSEVVKL